MKRNLIFAGIVALASLASCSKIENSFQNQPKGNVVTLTVNSEEWDASKSAYTPGVGVAMTGTEILSLYYVSDYNEEKHVDLLSGTDAQRNKSIKAVPSGSGKYTFTAPAASAGCTWYSIAGYSKNNTTLVSDFSAAGVIISPVQNPLPNSFDPHFDYMIGKPFQVNSDGTGTIECFKRLLAPLRLNISGLPEGEKIYTASLSFDQEPASNTSKDALVGKMYLHFGDEPDSCRVEYAEAAAKGNSVTAVYAEGLEAVSGKWPVWYIVYPATINAGSEMTVTVSTSNATYTRTVSLPADAKLSRAALNNINFNIKGEGYSKEESFTTVFAGATSGNITASNGKQLNWTYSPWVASSKDDGSGLSNAINLNNASVAIPNVYDKYVTKVSLVSHACNNLSLARESCLTVGTEPPMVLGFNFCSTANYDVNLLSTAGVATISLPSGVDSFEGVSFTGTAHANLVSAITLYTVDGGDSEPTIDEATGNDLYQEFLDGKKITINGVEYTKDNCTYVLQDLTSADNTELQAAGVHFLTGVKNFGSSTNFKIPASVVYIGRYQDNPAVISAGQIQPYYDAIFKNMTINGGNGSNTFPSSQYLTDSKLVFENCTVTNTGALARDVHATNACDLIIRNSRVTYNANNLFSLNRKTASSHSAKEYTVEGSTITCGAAAGLPLFDMTNGAFAPADLVFTFKNNSVSGAASAAGVFNFKTLKSLNISGNTFTSSEAGALIGSATAPSAASTVKGNTLPADWTVFVGDSIANITVE